MNKNNVYILSLESADIYSHMIRSRELKKDYAGMIPFSLELNKLRNEGLKTHTNKKTGKEISDDIINIKFKQKVQNGYYVIERKKKTLDKMIESNNKLLADIDNEINKNNLVKLNEKLIKLEKAITDIKTSIKTIENEIDLDNKNTIFSIALNDEIKDYTKWDEISNNTLREFLYENGFTISHVNEKTGEYIETRYIIYKRSSSKSRTGQVLAIKESLYNKMINWSRMYLNFDSAWNGDYAGLLAYESLVGSALEDIITIDVNRILIVNDLDSKFKWDVNVIKKDPKTGLLNSFRDEKYMVSNSLFDGESLLESTYFKTGQSMNLLRNHMYKSAAFSCNIQKFLRDNCPDGQDYETWEILNMFNEPILAKNVHMICTPTSLKALKFSKSLNMSEKEMWNYWKSLVAEEGNLFGICKHEKISKRGTDFEGNVVQQSSYQMLNCMNFSNDEIMDITTFEREYIMKLKNDDNAFLEYIAKNANDVNSNMMFVDLANHNKDFINTEMFRDFRSGEIHKYVNHVKRGKARLVGDYCIALGNPIEYLYHAIGVDVFSDKYKLSLKGNEVYTKMFDFSTKDNPKELVAFRNPTTSPSNALIAKNIYNSDIDNYFNLSKNIVCCNAIKFPIQDIASSMDYDSDSLVLFDNSAMLQVASGCFGKYRVCINAVESEKKNYTITKMNMAKIDNQLSTSQQNIGLVVNTGQHVMATYWDMLEAEKTEVELEELMKKVDVATVLSCICIDLAKKMYDIDLEKEIKNLAKTKELSKTKPLFFKYISQSETIGNRIKKYNCPMDYLQEIMSNLDNGEDRDNINLINLLEEKSLKKGDRKQEDKILRYIEEMCTKIDSIYAKYKLCSTDDEIEERNNLVDDIVKYYNYYIQKSTVKEDTMYSILYHMIKSENTKIETRLMNILYSTQKETFINAFKK